MNMQSFRQIATIILIPIYLLAGLLIGELLSNIFGVWNYHIFSILLPAIGLLFTWYVAPYYKIYNIVFVFLIGLVLAYSFAFPAYYPESHPMAYMPTYKPFMLSVAIGLSLLFILVIYELKRKEP
ncbi:hypothetical protein [Aurantivibrio infirmus]